jgi:hypothetical protein
MSVELGVPSRLVQQVLQTLLAARLVMEVSRGEPAFAPARPLDSISAHHVLMAMRATLGQELFTRDEPVRSEVYGEFARIQEAEREAASAVTMLALVHRAQARLELEAPAPADGELKLSHALIPPAKTVTVPEPEPGPGSAPEPPPIPKGRAASPTGPTPFAPKAATEVEREKATAAAQPASPSAPVVEPETDDERNFPL